MTAIDQPAAVAFSMPAAQVSDLERLVSYMRDYFPVRKAAIMLLVGESTLYPQQCFERMEKANFFAGELGDWLDVAQSIHTRMYAEALAVVQSVEGQRLLEQKRGLRPTKGMIEAAASEEVAPLEAAISRIEQSSRWCDRVVSSQQSMLRAFEAERFTGRAEGSGGDAGWTDFQQAPLVEALERLLSK